MKKKCAAFALIALVCMIGASMYISALSPDGNTVESREALLDRAISGGKNWTIAKETEINGYIISCAYSTNGKATIAVFEPASKGSYRFSTSTNRDYAEIIIGGTLINGEWYDLIWFNGAQTTFAEISHTVNGVKQAPLKYDTTSMDIICIKNIEKDYSIGVCYYDSEGNKYE